MKLIHAYLTFSGNCREAMKFYQECLGGELTFQTVGESLQGAAMPEKIQQCILHAVLKNNGLILMGTDMVPEKGLLKGNSVSLVLHCTNEKEIRTCYNRLSRGGEQTHPLKKTVWGAVLGEVIDRYGKNWLLTWPSAGSSSTDRVKTP